MMFLLNETPPILFISITFFDIVLPRPIYMTTLPPFIDQEIAFANTNTIPCVVLRMQHAKTNALKAIIVHC